MIGNGILAFAVIIVVAIFLYMSFRVKDETKETQVYLEEYNIGLIRGFNGSSISIFINDSLLLNETIKDDSTWINVKRFDKQNALLVVDNKTEKVSTFDLSEKGGTILLHKEGESVFQQGNQ